MNLRKIMVIIKMKTHLREGFQNKRMKVNQVIEILKWKKKLVMIISCFEVESMKKFQFKTYWSYHTYILYYYFKYFNLEKFISNINIRRDQKYRIVKFILYVTLDKECFSYE